MLADRHSVLQLLCWYSESYLYELIGKPAFIEFHENGHVFHLSGKPGADRSDSKNVFSPQPTKIHHAMAP